MAARVDRDGGELVYFDPGRPLDRVALRDHGHFERGACNRLRRDRRPLREHRRGEQHAQEPDAPAARAAIVRERRGRARAASRRHEHHPDDLQPRRDLAEGSESRTAARSSARARRTQRRARRRAGPPSACRTRARRPRKARPGTPLGWRSPATALRRDALRRPPRRTARSRASRASRRWRLPGAAARATRASRACSSPRTGRRPRTSRSKTTCSCCDSRVRPSRASEFRRLS